jgi:hypothetical protein
MVEPSAIEDIRLIRERSDIDLIPFLGKNLTSTGRWGWANFLFTFALVWAPLDHRPPFSIVTSAVVQAFLPWRWRAAERRRVGAGDHSRHPPQGKVRILEFNFRRSHQASEF